jgi:hypothetical protein
MQGKNKKCCSVLVSVKGRHHFRDLDTHGKLMLNWILPKTGYENVDKGSCGSGLSISDTVLNL